MKSAGLHLLFFVVAGTLAAQPAEPAPPAKTSARLTQEIRSALPKYVAPPENKTGTTGSAPRDPGLLVLPTVTVQEKRIPMDDPDTWLGERVIQQKAMAAYKASMTDFEWFLNSWHIPFLTPSASARARAAYKESKIQAELIRLNGLIETVKHGDTKAGDQLRKDYKDMQDAQDWQGSPAGSGRQK
ncbi:MAG TPA: hypothetical protein VKC51_05655 [Lacunisphaera sp.]|nr:hypothetical protein [Lacunisphaera sp.]